MNPVPLIPCALLFLAAQFCIFKANSIFSRILDEVNSKRPAPEQISFLFVNVRAFEVADLHRQLFPMDRKRRQMNVFGGVGLASYFSCSFASSYSRPGP